MKHVIKLILAGILVMGLAGCQSSDEKAVGYLKDAQALFDAGDLDKSRIQLRNALKLNPRLADAHFLNYRIFEKKQDYKGMFGALSSTLELNPDHLEAELAIGKLYLMGGKLDDAQGASDHARELAPKDYRVHILQGAIYARLERRADALKEGKTAYDAAPNDLDAVLLYAALLLQTGDHASALQVADKGLAALPNEPLVHLLKFNVLAAAGRREEAVAAMQGLIKLKPAALEYRRSLAVFYSRNGDTLAAEKVLREAVSDNPESVDAKLMLASFLGQSDQTAAINALKAFVEDDKTKSSRLAFALGDLYVKKGDLDEASAVYANVASSSQVVAESLEAKNRLVHIALRQSRREEAKKVIDEILAKDANNADALLSRALLELDDRDTDKAIADLRSVLREKPESDKAMVVLAQAYLQNSSNELAEQTLFNALKINPLNRLGVIQYARLKMQHGEFDAADAAIAKLVQGGVQDQEINALRMQLQLMRHDWAAANQLAGTMAQSSGNPAYPAYIEAVTLQAQKKYPESIAAFKKILDANPTMTGALAGITQSYRGNGEAAKGIEFVRKFVAAHPDDLSATFILSSELISAGQMAEAQTLLRNVIKAKPQAAAAYRALAESYLKQKDTESAAKVYEEAVEAMPQAVDLKLALASIRDGQGKKDDAAKQYRAILEISPGADVAANNLAVIVAGDGTDQARLKEAAGIAGRFENSEQPFFADTLGWIYFQQKNYVKAAELLGRVVKRAPNEGIFRYHLGATLFELKDLEGARVQLKKAEQLGKEKGTFEGYDAAIKLLVTIPQS